MTYTKFIVCLANSRKLSGRCIAGRELLAETFGDWVRPVSSRPDEEISFEEMRFEDGMEPVLLDEIEIAMISSCPHSCQKENHLIDAESNWRKVGRFPKSKLEVLREAPSTLWINGHHSYNGRNDRIPEGQADALTSSLVLIEPNNLVLLVERGIRRMQVRAEFDFNGVTYKLIVTDPEVERLFLRKGEGEYPHRRRAFTCVSIGEPYEGFRYKLVASIIDL